MERTKRYELYKIKNEWWEWVLNPLVPVLLVFGLIALRLELKGSIVLAIVAILYFFLYWYMYLTHKNVVVEYDYNFDRY